MDRLSIFIVEDPCLNQIMEQVFQPGIHPCIDHKAKSFPILPPAVRREHWSLKGILIAYELNHLASLC